MWDVWFDGQIVRSKIEHPWIINKIQRRAFLEEIQYALVCVISFMKVQQKVPKHILVTMF